MRDREVGGWYAGRTASGEIVPTKQCYAHAFVILAATSGILAGIDGSQELLGDALQIFDRFFWNEAEGLTWDTWNTAFTRADDYRGINANMHTVEAFLAVADVTGSAAYRARAGRIIDHVIGWARDNSWRIPEHFTGDWHPDLACNQAHPDDPFKPYGATPGHGIEWARLITQWALSTYGPDQTKCAEYHSAARELYDRAVTDGWSADGAPGIVYTTDWSGHPVVRDRMHWTLAEAINTSAVLYRVSRDQSYVEDYARFLRYLDQQVRDPIHGSWFHQLDAQNRVIGTVWPGKPDLYHALQATLIPYCDPARSVATFLAHSPAIS